MFLTDVLLRCFSYYSKKESWLSTHNIKKKDIPICPPGKNSITSECKWRINHGNNPNELKFISPSLRNLNIEMHQWVSYCYFISLSNLYHLKLNYSNWASRKYMRTSSYTCLINVTWRMNKRLRLTPSSLFWITFLTPPFQKETQIRGLATLK